MPLFVFPFFPESASVERPQPRGEVGVPGERGEAAATAATGTECTQRTPQEGDQEETRQSGLAGGEFETPHLTHDSDCSGSSTEDSSVLQAAGDQVSWH